HDVALAERLADPRARVRVPQVDAGAVVAGGQQPAVRAEGQRRHVIALRDPGDQGLTGGRVPDTDFAGHGLFCHAGGGDLPTVRAEGRADVRVRVAERDAQ